MARNSNSKRRKTSSRITNVRITDSVAGTDGLRVDRQMAAVKTSESQTRIVIGDILDLNVSSTETNGVYGFDNIYSCDDFVSMVQQYSLFRIRSIKFDIYDLNSGVAVSNQWGIFHDNYEGTPVATTRAIISDLPDSRVLSVGTGQASLYWVAHGSAENQFQADYSTGSPAQKFGGLRYYIGSNSATASKYSVQIHAVVDFRGRR